MISLIVTAYEDPNSTKESMKKLLNQKNFHEKFEIIAACPDEPTKEVIMDYKKKHPKIIRYVKQDGDRQKNLLMNKIMKIAKGDIIIWTDGNKFLDEDAVSQILKPFEDPSVGVVGGRPTAMNDKNSMMGYWAHLLTNASDKMREIRYKKGLLIEHCANLLAMRKGILTEIPLDVAEDAIISYLITEKGYKNVYVSEAKVFVMYPRNFKDWVKQKVRSIKAHEAMNKYITKKDIKMKSFSNELFYGLYLSLTYPRNLKELYWTLLLYPARFYIWMKAFYEIRVKKDHYQSSWSRSESTKVLDYKK
ncbi:MAG: glycosyltransferase [Candidatus Nanoarchaeia archaeon]|nr:glycosyltransferase [Candidatus Nanoarchaeia archaeon]